MASAQCPASGISADSSAGVMGIHERQPGKMFACLALGKREQGGSGKFHRLKGCPRGQHMSVSLMTDQFGWSGTDRKHKQTNKQTSMTGTKGVLAHAAMRCRGSNTPALKRAGLAEVLKALKSRHRRPGLLPF